MVSEQIHSPRIQSIFHFWWVCTRSLLVFVDITVTLHLSAAMEGLCQVPKLT